MNEYNLDSVNIRVFFFYCYERIPVPRNSLCFHVNLSRIPHQLDHTTVWWDAKRFQIQNTTWNVWWLPFEHHNPGDMQTQRGTNIKWGSHKTKTYPICYAMRMAALTFYQCIISYKKHEKYFYACQRLEHSPALTERTIPLYQSLRASGLGGRVMKIVQNRKIYALIQPRVGNRETTRRCERPPSVL